MTSRWLRVGVPLLAVLVAAIGLLVGVSHHTQGSSAPASEADLSQQVDGSTDGVASRVALTQAQQALDHRADRILAGAGSRLARVPFRDYSLTVAGSPEPGPAQLRNGRFRISVVVRYQLPVDRVQVKRVVEVTFRQSAKRWRIGSIGFDRRDLWAHGPVRAAREGRSLVIGSSSLSDRLPGLAAEVEDARRQVASFWSARWPARVVVLMPAQARTMKPLVGGGSVSRLPAVTHLTDGADGPVVRVILNPVVFLALPSLGQQIVLRHEITHVAQDAMGTGGTPTWLTEGLAEYVGYRGTGVPDVIVAGGALDSVRNKGVPRTLPTEDDFAFDLTSHQRTISYERGWAACRMIADRYGESRLIPFYRTVLKAPGDDDLRLRRATREVLGVGKDSFVSDWQSWLSDHA